MFANVGSLQIRQSLEADEGKYECVAENSVGVVYSYGANLYVRGKYEFNGFRYFYLNQAVWCHIERFYSLRFHQLYTGYISIYL